ncbi:MAG TPA: hypothetical protein DHH36_06680 [Afipia sp.]|nr:hypothetical protein [Afipia sp.]
MVNRLNSPCRIWRWPTAIAFLSILGLFSALLGGGGIWWVLCWIALALPLGLIGWFVARI